MECREVREYLPAYLDEPASPRPFAVAEHLRSCAGCRAELDRLQALRSVLTQAGEHTIEPPAWLLPNITQAVSRKAARIAAMRERRRQLADQRLAAASAIVVAGVVGAVLIRGRRRSRRTFARRVRELAAQA